MTECCLPGDVSSVFAVHLVEYAIAADHNEVMLIFLHFELNNVRVGYYNIGIATVLGLFSFDVSEGTRNRQTTRENPVGSKRNVRLVFLLSVQLSIVSN